ncbi:MAG: hypothetical protein V4664_01415 [Patescibacteria group bacterium]
MIQGVFFFAYFEEPLLYYHFAGMIHPSEDEASILVGQLTDKFGDSTLSDVCIGDEEITFTKQYARRRDIIHYCLRKASTPLNLWVGTYKGTGTGTGRVNCLITEVPMGFLSPALAENV